MSFTMSEPAVGPTVSVLVGDGEGGLWQLDLEITSVEADTIRCTANLHHSRSSKRLRLEMVGQEWVFDTTSDVSRVERGRSKESFDTWDLSLEYRP